MSSPNLNISGKRNYYVSYLKGLAILAIILIHLMDWSGIELTETQKYLKPWLYPSVLFFIALSGAVIFIAYGKYDNLLKITKKLLIRGLQLIGIYFLYNLVKLYIFNFDTEPFYGQFSYWGKLNTASVLTLKSFTAPITIILTIGIFLILSPILMYIVKRCRFSKIIILSLIGLNLILIYVVKLPENILTNFLLSKNNVMFPLLLWSIPYLIGFYLAQIGLEKRRYSLFVFFWAMYLIFGSMPIQKIPDFMYPLRLPYIFFSFAFMYFLIIILGWIKKLPFKFIRWLLGILNMLGDKTLSIYIIHWIIIDLSIWFLYPKFKYIWLSVAVYLLIQIYYKRKQIVEHLPN